MLSSITARDVLCRTVNNTAWSLSSVFFWRLTESRW